MDGAEGADGDGGAGPAFAPAPLELCRLAEVVPEQVCAMLADVPRPSFAPDLAAWAPNAGAVGPIAPQLSSLSSPRGTATAANARAPSTGAKRSGTTSPAGLGAMGATGRARRIKLATS